MRNRYPILALLFFLGLAFLGDYIFQILLDSSGGVIPYLWLVALCEFAFGAVFLGFMYLSLSKEWLTREIAITYMIIGGFLLIFTPLWVSIFQIPAVNQSIYTQFPGLVIPAIPPNSLFAFAAILLVVIGAYKLLPTPKKRKK